MLLLKQLTPPFLIILFFFIILFGFTKLAGPIPFSVNSITTNKSDFFLVTGQGKVNAKPDIATISLGVQTNNATVKQTQDAMNLKINQVTEAVKKLGIDQKDIQTQNYNIYPSYDNPFQTKTPPAPIRSLNMESVEPIPAPDQKITGYAGNTNISIKIRKIEDANKVIDAATAAGANLIGNINFEIENKTKLENEARAKGVAEAKKKAEEAAKTAGFKLGKLVNYSEDSYTPGGSTNMAYGVAQKDTDISTNTEPGSLDIVINVTLSYEIR